MGFFTWNGPPEKLHILFNEFNRQHPDIRLKTISIGSNVHFLNAHIENVKGSGGRLYTRVYHDPTIQRYILPYVHGHARLIYRQWFRSALIRAARYCSSIEDFDEERLEIELTFLANGYSLDFVESQVRQFFIHFKAITLPSNPNQTNYESLRRLCLLWVDQQRLDYEQQEILKTNDQLVQFHYLYDWGPRYEFNQIFQQLWSDTFKKDPSMIKAGLKMKLNTKHCYSSNALLTHP